MSTLRYLKSSVNFAECSSSAEVPEIIRLAKLDIEEGATVAELVFWCCYYYPRKEAIEKLIELETDSEERLVKNIFEFRGYQDINCLMSLFQLPNHHKFLTKKHVFGRSETKTHVSNIKQKELINNREFTMLQNIENSCMHLIALAKCFSLDLEKILNHSRQNGDTLILYASRYSEELTNFLLDQGVRDNSINNAFGTPSFQVRNSCTLSKKLLTYLPFSLKVYNNL